MMVTAGPRQSPALTNRVFNEVTRYPSRIKVVAAT